MRKFARLCAVFLVCILLINIMIRPLAVPVSATSITAGTIAAVSAVNVPAALAIGAGAITLGVMLGERSDDFQNMVSNATSTLTNWVKDGTVELMRAVDEAGTAAYYVAGDMLEDLRSWFFDSGALCCPSIDDPFADYDTDNDYGTYSFSYAIQQASKCDSYAIIRMNTGEIRVFYAGNAGAPASGYPVYVSGNYLTTDSNYHCYWRSSDGRIPVSRSHSLTGVASYQIFAGGVVDPTVTDRNLSLGVIPTVPIDGTSARQWSEEYTNKGLYVMEGGGSNPDDGDHSGKWFWPLALALTAAELYAFSQADEWSGVTPPEFSEYQTATEFEILSRPEVEFGHGIEIQPIPEPAPEPEPEPEPDPDPEPEPDPNPEPEPDPNPEPAPDPGVDPDPVPDIDPTLAPDNPSDGTGEPPPFIDMTMNLKNFFPFCIPFDIYEFLKLLAADPVSPEFDLKLFGFGKEFTFHVDLSPFDGLAALVRSFELMGFIIGLGIITRDKFLRG